MELGSVSVREVLEFKIPYIVVNIWKRLGVRGAFMYSRKQMNKLNMLKPIVWTRIPIKYELAWFSRHELARLIE